MTIKELAIMWLALSMVSALMGLGISFILFKLGLIVGGPAC